MTKDLKDILNEALKSDKSIHLTFVKQPVELPKMGRLQTLLRKLSLARTSKS